MHNRTTRALVALLTGGLLLIAAPAATGTPLTNSHVITTG